MSIAFSLQKLIAKAYHNTLATTVKEFIINELLKLTMLCTTDPWVFSAKDTLYSFFLENRLWHFMQIVSLVDNLHEMSKLFFFWEKEKNSVDLFELSHRLVKFNNKPISIYVRMCKYGTSYLSHMKYHIYLLILSIEKKKTPTFL